MGLFKVLLQSSVFRHCEENYEVIDEAISGYLTRLPRSLLLLAMTIRFLRRNNISDF
ncbi:hypothetical protein Rsl_346 [Rickettsia slovaca 13-B]|uniref:Uncharacterized protein n=1 Tax=Rickettsia slovaca (strain 13-B) TaxID=941638 RepID=A0ABM5MNJ5_RICS1|nr:hypothetical protein Rsl_346 [Rickettsia slovaca 13-B]